MTDIKDLEKTLWITADKLRNNMDAAEYKHVVLGLIFLKYISDAFYAHHYKLLEGEGDFAGADENDPDEYAAYNVFFVPETARWKYLQDRAGKSGDTDHLYPVQTDHPKLRSLSCHKEVVFLC